MKHHIISDYNPIKLTLSGVNEKRIENAYYRGYYQKFQLSDVTQMQFIYNSVIDSREGTLYFKDEQGNIYTNGITSIVGSLPYTSTLDKYIDYTINFSYLPEGKYKLIREWGFFNFESEWLCVKQHHENTIAIHYKHSENHRNIYFKSGIFFTIRVESEYPYKATNPILNANVHEYDYGAIKTISAYPSTTTNLNIGGSSGIPYWFAKRVNNVFTCDYIGYDSKTWSVINNSKLAPNTIENYDLASWNIELSETKNDLVYDIDSIMIKAGGDRIYTTELNLEFDYTSSSKQIFIYQNNYGWKIYSAIPDWISVSRTEAIEGHYSNTTTVTVSNNFTAEKREACVYIMNTYTKEYATIKITQLFNNSDRRIFDKTFDKTFI